MNKKLRITRPRLILAGCLLALMVSGLTWQIISRAAGSVVAVEGESGSRSAPAAILSDTTASAGAAVRFGNQATVPATINSDCTTDVSNALLSWIDSVPDYTTLTFGTNKCYRVEVVLEFRNRNGLVFAGNGSTFRSQNAPDDQRAFWRFIDSTDIVIRDMTITGSYANGGTFSSALQHAHAIDLRGTSATLTQLTMTKLAGDCVYFGMGYTSAMKRSSGALRDSSCTSIGRNAVSVTAGDDIRVERVTTSQVGYIVYDVEPNIGPGWGAQRVVIDNNTIGTYYLHAFSIVENGPVRDISFTNNRAVGKGMRLAVGPVSTTVRPANVTITGNSSDTPINPVPMNVDNVDGVIIRNNTIPLTSGRLIQVDNSCNVSISGNSYPGGTQEYIITNTPTNCP